MNKKVLAGLLIGALFLFLTIRQIDFSSCWHYIRQADLWWVALGVVVYSLAFVVRSHRWKYLIAPLCKASAGKLFSYLILGFFMNNVLPLRLGELIRAHITGQKLNAPRSGVLATVVVERLFDGLSYVCLFALTVLFLPFPAWAKKSMSAGSLVFVGSLCFLFVFVRYQERFSSLLGGIRVPLPGKVRALLGRLMNNFMGGLQVFTQGQALAKVVALSLLVWVLEGVVFFVMGNAFSMHLSLFQCFLVMIVIGIGAILPTAPGYVGTVEFLGVTSLAYLGYNKNLAFGYIITLHVLQLLTIAFWGIRSLVAEKISFNELIRIEKQPQI